MLELDIWHRRGAVASFIAVGALLGPGSLYSQEPGAFPEDQLAAMAERITALEQKLQQLERSASRVRAPFEVVDENGKGILKVEMRPDGTGLVALADATGEDNAVLLDGRGAVEILAGGNIVAGLRSETDGRGLVFVMNGENRVAELTSSPDERTGLLSINDASGTIAAVVEGSGYVAVVEESQSLVSMTKDGGRGTVTVSNSSGDTLAKLSENLKGSGELNISGAGGSSVLQVAETASIPGTSGVTIGAAGGSDYVIDIFGKSKQKVVSIGQATVGGGALAAYNASGNIGAILSGTGQVHVADDGGVTLATMVAENGEGAFSVRNKAGSTVVRLSDGKEGGMLQLASATGNAMVEAGSLQGRGIVRAYPIGHPGMGMVGMPGTFITGLLDLN